MKVVILENHISQGCIIMPVKIISMPSLAKVKNNTYVITKLLTFNVTFFYICKM